MFIPIGTDAPIRHWPIATGIFIFLNVFGFILQHQFVGRMDWADRGQSVAASTTAGFDVGDVNARNEILQRTGVPPQGALNPDQLDPDEFDPRNWKELVDRLRDEPTAEELAEIRKETFDRIKDDGWHPFALWIGEGIHPLQWLTSFFMHGDPGHLIGNMIFLALFGLVVESRMGSIPFAIYYLAIGLIDSAIVQLCLLGADSGFAIGASGAIYGLMVTAMIWSPKFNIICLVIIWIYVYFPRVPILIFGVIYVLLDVGGVLFGVELVDTPLLHVFGAAVGAVTAIVVMQNRWVDTNYEDVVSLAMEAAGKDLEKMKRERPLTRKELEEREQAAEVRQSNKQHRVEQLWKSIDAHLAANNLDAAIAMERQARLTDSKSYWDEPRLLRLIGKLQSQKQWDNVILFSERYLERYKSRATTIRLNLAKVILLQKHMPRKTLNVLKPLESTSLSLEQSKQMRQIIAKAKQMIDEGTLEFGD